MTTATPADRAALISQHLGVSRPFSPVASALIERLQIDLSEAAALDPAEEARLLSALMLQISGRLAGLHGNR